MSFACRKNDVVQAYHRQSNGVFAAFKVHSMAEKMAALLTDADGNKSVIESMPAKLEK